MPLSLLFLLFTSLLAIFADAFLLIGALSRGTAIISASLACLTLIILRQRLGLSLKPIPAENKTSRLNLLPLILTCISSGALIWIILKHPITISVRSPWPSMPGLIFIIAGLLFLSITLSAFLTPRSPASFSWFLTAFPYLSLLALTFPLGYGFDPLLHQAAEQSIAVNGLIHPLPILYGAYYSLVVSLHLLTGIALPMIDNFLVPTLSALTIPSMLSLLVPSEERSVSKLGLFLLPIAFLTMSTPFSFALLLFLTVVTLSTRAKQQDFLIIGILSVCAFLAHALAGLGALAIFFAAFFKRSRDRLAFAFVFPLAIPVLMFAKAFFDGKHLNYAMHPDRLFSWLPNLPQITNLLTEDVAYLAVLIIGVIYLALVIRGILHCHTNTGVCETGAAADRSVRDSGYGLLAVATSLFITALILRVFDWPDIISYEQTDFSSRLLFMALLALSPFAIQALGKHLGELVKIRGLAFAGSVILISILATAHWYSMYPRQDRHEVSHGFNTSQADYDAVETINADARGKSYIVLAPQNISAAYINRFGFPSKLIPTEKGEILPYPIPTGGPLYPLFEQFAVNPQPQFIMQAQALTKQQLVYVALPDFWTNSENTRRITETFASGSWRVDDQVTIFKFESTR